MNVDILGRRWKITTMAPEAFNKRFEGPAAGVTIPRTRQIVINTEDLTFCTVAHEIFHASLDGLCISAADLTQEQFEEVNCELFAVHGVTLLKLAMKLTAALKRAL